eukprot:758405-Hanusia_phi.AAC.2
MDGWGGLIQGCRAIVQTMNCHDHGRVGERTEWKGPASTRGTSMERHGVGYAKGARKSGGRGYRISKKNKGRTQIDLSTG